MMHRWNINLFFFNKTVPDSVYFVLFDVLYNEGGKPLGQHSDTTTQCVCVDLRGYIYTYVHRSEIFSHSVYVCLT